jgi:tRNA 2-thiouridine synthesizing protein A
LPWRIASGSWQPCCGGAPNVSAGKRVWRTPIPASAFWLYASKPLGGEDRQIRPLIPNPEKRDNGNEESFDKVIDVRGLYCPEPVFRTKIEIEKLGIGSKLKIIADDPESEEDITRWADKTGHNLLSVQKKDNELEFVIKKTK